MLVVGNAATKSMGEAPAAGQFLPLANSVRYLTEQWIC